MENSMSSGERELPERWSAKRKAEIVLRLLRGEDLGEIDHSEIDYVDLDPSMRREINRRLREPLKARQVSAAIARPIGFLTILGQVDMNAQGGEIKPVTTTVGGIIKPIGLIELRGAARFGSNEKGLAAGASLQLFGLGVDVSALRAIGDHEKWGAGIQLRFRHH